MWLSAMTVLSACGRVGYDSVAPENNENDGSSMELVDASVVDSSGEPADADPTSPCAVEVLLTEVDDTHAATTSNFETVNITLALSKDGLDGTIIKGQANTAGYTGSQDLRVGNVPDFDAAMAALTASPETSVTLDITINGFITTRTSGAFTQPVDGKTIAMARQTVTSLVITPLPPDGGSQYTIDYRWELWGCD